MPNPNYLKGRRYEHELVKEFTELGYIAFRSAGSRSVFDVVAINPKNGYIQLIQCKTTESEATADRLIEDFRKSPPIPPLRLPPKVAQILSVKISRKGRLEAVV